MADSNKIQLTDLGQFVSMRAAKSADSNNLRPVAKVSAEDKAAIDEDYDIGQSNNKSGLGMGWYVLHTYSGYENKVKTYIENAVENQHLEDKILEVKVPMQDVVEVKASGKKTVQKKLLPGYVLVNMDPDDEKAWYVVRNTRGVTGFVGPGGKPVPVSETELFGLSQEKKLKADFELGDLIVVTDGAWKDTTGNVVRIDEKKQTATINVEMFGRETPVEISFADAKKMD